jgi:hypothetical protein
LTVSPAPTTNSGAAGDTSALAATLKAPIPPEFSALGEGDLAALDATLHAAAAHRSTQLNDAITASLKHLPALLRPAVKKALGL